MRDSSEALLDEHRLRCEGLLEPGPIRGVWSEHVTGCGYRQHDLVLMLQAWIEEQRAPSPVRRRLGGEHVSARCLLRFDDICPA